MKFTKEIVETINTFIINSVPDHGNDIISCITSHFGLSKPTATKYLNSLITEGIIAREQKGRYPQYHLVDRVLEYAYTISGDRDEDRIWRRDIAPHVQDCAPNVRQICQYGFTEMVNNIIEHSGAERFTIKLAVNALNIQFTIFDNGVGIFNKIKNDLGLEDPRHSILELAKGKFTSDPQHHSGEGIFFSSRICDRFYINSDGLLFFGHRDNDGLLETPGEIIRGTLVVMAIRKDTPLQIADVFNEYTDPDKQPSFHRTAIPVRLMQYEGDSLISRSQAKRLITRFDRFLEVVLDFTGVDMIGQGFGDEIFRVFANAHPTVHLKPINCSENVKNMILHVTSGEVSNEE